VASADKSALLRFVIVWRQNSKLAKCKKLNAIAKVHFRKRKWEKTM
jgi:hypothetical protein